MSFGSPPSYAEIPLIPRAPEWIADPQPHEPRTRPNGLRTRPSGEFVKQTMNGAYSLRLVSQRNTRLPTYGLAGAVEGVVTVSKPEIEGTLRLQEIAESGTSTTQLCLVRSILWSRGTDRTISCPASLPFKLTLPTTYLDRERTYPLPPSYEEHLSGVPGFRANIDYVVHAIISTNTSVMPNLMKTALFGNANVIVSTPFIYYPRTRPATPPPVSLPLSPSNIGFAGPPDWNMFEGRSTSRVRGGQEIISKLYLPTSRVFCLRQPIPFHLTFVSSAFSLAAFSPLLPRAARLSPNKQYTKIELLRQSTVDVRNQVNMAAKTDIWRVDCIGVGSFKHGGDGPNWISYSGEIVIENDVELGGFRVGGLSVKDCVVLSVTPPDPVKSHFRELRQVVPVRLTTDPWMPNVGNYHFEGSEVSGPSSEDHLELLPEINYC